MDKGPWIVFDREADEHVVVRSDDFEHDVVLAIYGDFADFAQKRAYAEWLARRLNGRKTTGNGDR